MEHPTYEQYLRKILLSPVYDVAKVTPLQKLEKVSEKVGVKVLLKREDLQSVHSFKLRGAYNKIAGLTKEQLDKGVIAASAGNHAQGVALGAKECGIKAVICLPAGIVPLIYACKVNNKLAQGDIAGAQAASKKAKLWRVKL